VREGGGGGFVVLVTAPLKPVRLETRFPAVFCTLVTTEAANWPPGRDGNATSPARLGTEGVGAPVLGADGPADVR
jgi:hypothetical protein